MIYIHGAPEMIWAIPDAVLDDGAKLTLMRLWSKADDDIQRNPAPTDVWAKKREGLTQTESLHADLADARGCSVRKIRRHLTKLRALGLAEASGRLVHLTPPVCGQPVTADGQSCPQTVDRKRSAGDHERADDDRQRSGRDRKRSAHLNQPDQPSQPDPTKRESAPSSPQPDLGSHSAQVAETRPRTGPPDLDWGDRKPDRPPALVWPTPEELQADADKIAAARHDLGDPTRSQDLQLSSGDSASPTATSSPLVSQAIAEAVCSGRLERPAEHVEPAQAPDQRPAPTAPRESSDKPTAQLTLVGETPEQDRPPTDRQRLDAFWAWFNAQRLEAWKRWRPEAKVRELRLTKGREQELRARMRESAAPGSTLAQHLDLAKHVVLVARNELDADQGRVDPFGSGSDWDSMRRLQDHWLRAKHFERMAGLPAAGASAPRAPRQVNKHRLTGYNTHEGFEE